MQMKFGEVDIAKIGLGPNFAHLDGGAIKRKFKLRKCGTF